MLTPSPAPPPSQPVAAKSSHQHPHRQDAGQSAGKVCGEPGRAMFYEYLGKLFAVDEPHLTEMPLGTACSVCGCKDVPLVNTEGSNPSKGQNVCRAQRTITRKRAARKSADEPCAPQDNKTGKTCFGKGHMVVAGPHVAVAVSNLLPDEPLPAGVDVRYPEKGVKSALIDSLFTDPPPGPFVVIEFAQGARYLTRVSVSSDHLIVNGPDGYSVNIAHLRELAAELRGLKPAEITELMSLRDAVAEARQTRKDVERLRELAAKRAAATGINAPLSLTARLLPPRGTPAARVLLRLFAIDQNETEGPTEEVFPL